MSLDNVVVDGIGPVIAPGELAVAGDGAAGLEVVLDNKGVVGIVDEEPAFVDAVPQFIGELMRFCSSSGRWPTA
jgi:hypothetical protein